MLRISRWGSLVAGLAAVAAAFTPSGAEAEEPEVCGHVTAKLWTGTSFTTEGTVPYCEDPCFGEGGGMPYDLEFVEGSVFVCVITGL